MVTIRPQNQSENDALDEASDPALKTAPPLLVFASESWISASSDALDRLAGDFRGLSRVSLVEAGQLHQMEAGFVLLLPMEPVPDRSDEAGPPMRDLLRTAVARWTLALELTRRAARVVFLDLDPMRPDAVPSVVAAATGEDRCVSLEQQAWVWPAGWSDGALESQRACVDVLLNALKTGGEPTITWRPELFLDGDRVGKDMPRVIDVAGRPRILCYGPYLPLPTGRWDITATMGFSEDINRLPFIIELDVGEVVARGFFQPKGAGFFATSFRATIDKPLQLGEIRVISQEPALEGKFALIEVTLRPWAQNEAQSAA